MHSFSVGTEGDDVEEEEKRSFARVFSSKQTGTDVRNTRETEKKNEQRKPSIYM